MKTDKAGSSAVDPKTRYLVKAFRHTQNKDWENYVVLGIWHRLRIKGLDIKPVTQQYVRRGDGRYALLDLYFPGLNFAVECDEVQHKANAESDVLREKDVFKAFGTVDDISDVYRAEYLLDKRRSRMDEQTRTMTMINAEKVDRSRLKLARVDASLSYPEIDKQLDSIVSIMVQRFEDANRPTWDMSAPQETVKASGKITTDMDIVFPLIVDILNALNIRTVKGVPYVRSPQSGSVKVPNQQYTWIWFANVALDNNGGWNNILKENGSVIEEQSRGELNKSARNHWMRVCRMASEDRCVYRVTFAKATNDLGEKGYRFMGVFQLVGGWTCKGNDVELESVNGGYHLVWKRINTEFARLPDPQKGIKMRKANAHNDVFEAAKLKKRLKQQSVVWVLSDCPSEMAEVPLITDLSENSHWDADSPDVFLYTDPRLSEYGKKLFARGRGEKITLGEGRMSVELTKKRDYGRVSNLDVEGGLYKYNLDDANTGRVVEFEASFTNRGAERRTKRVLLAAVESMEFAARFLVADKVGISAVVLNVFHASGMGNGLMFAGAWPFHIAAALGAKRLVADDESLENFCQYFLKEETEKMYEKALGQYPCLKQLPETEIKDSGVRVGEGLYNLPLSLYRIGLKDDL